MTDPLLRIAYASRSLGAVDEAALAEILAVSRRNNRRAGVTGALLFSEQVFVQVLEGPPAAVEAVFERIQTDERHTDVVVLLAERTGRRCFGAWEMAYAGEDAAVRAAFAELDLEALLTAQPAARGLIATLGGALARTEAQVRAG